MMMMTLLIAAALGQAAEPEIFAEAEGWSIARHVGGCLMTREFGGDGNTIVTFAVTPADATAPLTVLVGNSGWTFPEGADDGGYQIEFSGNDAVWQDLAARTFNTDGDSGDRDGVISIDFARDAITPLLADVAAASGLHLSRQGVTVDRVAFTGTGAAVSKLGECIGTLP
jgi:hypothetical protein